MIGGDFHSIGEIATWCMRYPDVIAELALKRGIEPSLRLDGIRYYSREDAIRILAEVSAEPANSTFLAIIGMHAPKYVREFFESVEGQKMLNESKKQRLSFQGRTIGSSGNVGVGESPAGAPDR